MLPLGSDRRFHMFSRRTFLNEYLWEIVVSGVSQMCHSVQARFLWLPGSAQKESSRGDRTDISNCPVKQNLPTSKKTKDKDMLKSHLVFQIDDIWFEDLKYATQTPKFNWHWHCIIWQHVCVCVVKNCSEFRPVHSATWVPLLVVWNGDCGAKRLIHLNLMKHPYVRNQDYGCGHPGCKHWT